MSKIIKNKRTVDSVVYAGMTIGASSSYTIPTDELGSFQSNSLLLSHLLDEANETVMIDSATPTQEIVGVAAMNYLLDNIPKEVTVMADPPFQSKTLPDGSKLYRRKHGVSAVVPAGGSASLFLVVPYDKAKINKVEIVNGKAGDAVDLKVYDTPTGTISTVPNYMLNQFGFEVFLPDGYYEDESRYDADMIKDMKIEIVYHNNGAEEITAYANVVLHQVV